MTQLRNLSRRFLRNERAATMVEYAIMVALIAIVCFAAVVLVGTSTNAALSDVADKMPS